jgi:hypothetical protein
MVVSENIIIYTTDGEISIVYDTDSYCRREVMGEHAITLTFSYPEYLVVPIGSYIEYKGVRYTLYNPSDFKKDGNRKYHYTLKLYSYQELLNDRIFINEPDGLQVFPRRGRPIEFIEAIVRNMNHFDVGDWDGSEWTFDPEKIISSNVQQEIQFNGVTCFEALRLVAEAFKTEWEVNNKEISLRKVEYFRDAPIRLSYGKGNGFLPGLGRGNYDESRPIHKLYVKGGERNIDFNQVVNGQIYGSNTLLLPKNKKIRYDGSKFEEEDGFRLELAREYQTDANGTSLTRIGVPQTSRREAFIELTEAYPKWQSRITKIVWKYGENGTERVSTTPDGSEVAYNQALADAQAAGKTGADVFCDIFDTTIPESLNFANLRIDGEQMTVIPQTGRLSGVEFSLPQGEDDASDGYIHTERRFKLNTDSYYSGFIPDSRIAVGDEYAVFGMKMPYEYILVGENDLLKEAVRYKYENEDLRFTFTGELDGIYAQDNWTNGDNIGWKVVAGGYVEFSDPAFYPDGTLIRISAIKEFLHEPYKPKLELTNIVIGGGLKSELTEIPKQEVINNEQDNARKRLEYRRWRDAEETKREIDIMFADMGEAIRASSLEAMYARFGNKMGQFRFTLSPTDNTIAKNAPTIEYYPLTNQVRVSGNSAGLHSYIQHQLMDVNGNLFDIDGKSPIGDNNTEPRPASEYKKWTIPSYQNPSNEPLEKNKFYWVLVRVSKSGTDGAFLVEQYNKDNPREYDPGDGYYYLIVGGLNSEFDGERSFFPLFGFTEILPGQMTIGKIRSIDGKTYFDLNAGTIAGNINFIDGLISGNIGIYNGEGQITAAINGDNSNLSNIAFSAGINNVNAPFRVLHNGSLYANNAQISGTINASSGRIGAFNITPTYIGEGSQTSNGVRLSLDDITVSNPSNGNFTLITNADTRATGTFIKTNPGSTITYTINPDAAITATSRKGKQWALDIQYGSIAGLGFNFRNITQISTILVQSDSYVYYSATAAGNVVLDYGTNFTPGKIFFIKRGMGAGSLTISTLSGGNEIEYENRLISNFVMGTDGMSAMVINTGSNWILNLFNVN